MPSYVDGFPSTFLKVDDLKGGRLTVVIDHVALEMIGQGTDRKTKWVAYFVNDDPKPLVLNRTNADEIASLAGSDDTDEWAGLRIELFPSTTMYQGKRVGCLRVGSAPPAAAQPGGTRRHAGHITPLEGHVTHVRTSTLGVDPVPAATDRSGSDPF